MKIKQVIATTIFLLMLFSFSSAAIADFPKWHAYQTISSLRTTESPIANLCREKEDQVLLGNAGSDVPVIHYLEGKLESYKGFHSRGAFERCLQIAGSDVDLKCTCYGIATHVVQDRSSHYDYVPNNIKKYFGANVIVHPIVELAAEQQLLDKLRSNPDPVMSVDEVEFMAKHSLDLYFEEQKYADLFNDVSKLDMRQDFAVVDGALKGERWRDAVYGKEVSYPAFYVFGSSVFIIVGLFGMIGSLIIGKNNFKWINILFFTIILIIGIALLWSVLAGKSWIWFNYVAKAPAAIINVGDQSLRIEEVKQATRIFLQTEQLSSSGIPLDDASGLDHFDRFNNFHEGPLQQAETRFVVLWFTTVPTIIVLLLFSMWKSTKRR